MSRIAAGLIGFTIGVISMAIVCGLNTRSLLDDERAKAVRSGAAKWAINAETGEPRFVYIPATTK